MKILLLFCLGVLLTACNAGTGEGLDENGLPASPTDDPQDPPQDETPLEPTLASIQQNIFSPICSQCHAGNNPPAGLSLESLAISSTSLVNVDSTTDNRFKRVLPGSPDESFLYLKIIGDPIAGAQMPLGQPPLEQAAQDAIAQWIASGAPIDQTHFTAGVRTQRFTANKTGMLLTFSQSVNPATLTPDQIRVQFDEQIMTPDGLTLNWVRPDQLMIHIRTDIQSVNKLTLTLNQDSLGSVLTPDGVWLDGDRDGYSGGELNETFVFHP